MLAVLANTEQVRILSEVILPLCRLNAAGANLLRCC